MTKFYGKIGYGETVETKPDIWELVITERSAYGDVFRISRSLDNGDKVNDDISVGNNISIVADAYANGHFFAMKYVEWAGVLWEVTKVEEQRPRLILTLGGVYNGPTAAEEDAEGGSGD